MKRYSIGIISTLVIVIGLYYTYSHLTSRPILQRKSSRVKEHVKKINRIIIDRKRIKKEKKKQEILATQTKVMEKGTPAPQVTPTPQPTKQAVGDAQRDAMLERFAQYMESTWEDALYREYWYDLDLDEIPGPEVQVEMIIEKYYSLRESFYEDCFRALSKNIDPDQSARGKIPLGLKINSTERETIAKLAKKYETLVKDLVGQKNFDKFIQLRSKVRKELESEDVYQADLISIHLFYGISKGVSGQSLSGRTGR